MKKITLYTIVLVLLSCKMTALNAQNVNIPDANFKAELIYDPNININNDNEIQVSEAEAYNDDLEIDGKYIADLTGIEAFTNLEELDCSNNQLTTLDLTSNINLEKVNCSNNQLNVLSTNTFLKKLDCSNNQLINLDLSANTRIEKLNCSGNNLTDLDVSSNTNLEKLNCSNNQLNVLNINTRLKELDCSINQLSSLDLSANTRIKELNCSSNDFTTLDVSSNTNLEELNCSNNQLMNLNLKNGNNQDVSDFNTLGNTNLVCITVDDPTYSTMNWSNIDANTIFSADCRMSISTISELNSRIAISPNPASTHLDLTLKQGTIELVEVLDMTGARLQKQLVNDISCTLNIRNLPSGIYIVKISTREGTLAVQRFVKKSNYLGHN